ncbi:MAG: 50S ribosomal protein L3 [Nanoarchaeota archaeon]
MGKARNPRHGSMQFWPRVRAEKEVPVVKSWAKSAEAKPLGFAGYKVGMTHVQYKEEEKSSPRKGEIVSVPVTIIECPPLTVAGVRVYATKDGSKSVVADVFAPKQDKHLAKRVAAKSKRKLDALDAAAYDDVVLLVHTNPSETGMGKKKPEIFEVAIGGSKDEKLAYAKENLGKQIAVSDVFADGEFVDTHAVTKGKGYQGAVKRFGVAIRSHKSEKGRRAPGSLGGWISQQHTMYRIAHAGQMGYHTRTHYNNKIFKIGDTPDQVNAKGGFIRYGNVRSSYVLIKGSVQGPVKRLVRFNKPVRAKANRKPVAPAIQFVSTASKQGNRISDV